VSGRARLLLWGSLALNLFLAGLIVGALLLGERGRRDRGPKPPRSLLAAAEQFEPAEREAFEALLLRKAQESRPQARALRRARGEVRAAISAEPYDPAAAVAAMDRARAQEIALRRELDSAVLEFATRLDAEERAALAEAMRRRGGSWRRGLKGEGRGPGPEAPGARPPG
jgi:uncharacterized membrane protein